MTGKLFIAAANNTLAPALGVLQELGFAVSSSDENLLQAETAECRLVAEDTLQLLGLATLVSRRGSAWRPSDAEVNDLLRLLQGLEPKKEPTLPAHP